MNCAKLTPPDMKMIFRWFPSSSLGTDTHEALLQVLSRRSDDTGSWSFPTGFPSWSLGTSGWMYFYGKPLRNYLKILDQAQ
jgi:hypothetical protein